MAEAEFKETEMMRDQDLEDAFHAGLLAALAVVALHDLETLYREIVATADERALVDFAKRDGALDFSGLSRYGYHLG